VILREPTSEQEKDTEIGVRARVMTRRPDGGQVLDDWIDVPFLPGSPEGNYCVIRKNGQRTQELLEKTAAEVVRATEALAVQESEINFRVTKPSLVAPPRR
jgi:hypothetical protein